MSGNQDSPQYGPTALPQGANDGGDGSTKEKATWVAGNDKNARSFIVKQGNTFVRCNMFDALAFWDMRYHVFDVPSDRRVRFEYKGPGRPQNQPFAHQYWEIQQEEHASLVGRDRLPGEDLGEDAEEEFEITGDPLFDPVEQPPLSGTRGNLASSTPSGGRGRPSTPRGRGSGSQLGFGRGQVPSRSPTSPSSGEGKGPTSSPGGGAV